MARTKVFRCSAKSLGRIRWWGAIIATAATVVILGVGVADWLGTRSNALALLIAGVLVAVLADWLVVWASVDRYRAARDRTAAVTATAIERREANPSRSLALPYESMRALWIWRFRSGEVAAIAVRGEQGRPLRFSGFDDMDSMARQVRDAAPPACEIQERRQWVDLGNPLVGTALLAAMCAVFLSTLAAVHATLGEPAVRGLSGAGYYAAGLFYLVFRPTAVSSLRRFTWVDVVLGALCLALGSGHLLLALRLV